MLVVVAVVVVFAMVLAVAVVVVFAMVLAVAVVVVFVATEARFPREAVRFHR
jgi:hypothetical protein